MRVCLSLDCPCVIFFFLSQSCPLLFVLHTGRSHTGRLELACLGFLPVSSALMLVLWSSWERQTNICYLKEKKERGKKTKHLSFISVSSKLPVLLWRGNKWVLSYCHGEHQRTQSPGCGYSDSEERNQALPGIRVLLGSWFAGAGQEREELGTLVKEHPGESWAKGMAHV